MMCDSDYGSDYGMDISDMDISSDIDCGDLDMDISDTLDFESDLCDISDSVEFDEDFSDSVISDIDITDEDIKDGNDLSNIDIFDEMEVFGEDFDCMEDVGIPFEDIQDFEPSVDDSYIEFSDEVADFECEDLKEDESSESSESLDIIEDDCYEDLGDGELKILERDPEELMDTGMRNIEDILDVRRDDMLDKGMSEKEIEDALNIERVELQEEFLRDAFPEYDITSEEVNQAQEVPDNLGVFDIEDVVDNGSGDIKILERDPEELMDTGMRNIEDILDVRRDDMLDKGMSEKEIEEALNTERIELEKEFIQDAFQQQNEDFGNLDLQEMDDITEEEREKLVRDVVEQNVTVSTLPKTGGHWLDEATPGDTKWILDDDIEITWRKAGETHVLSGKELKEKYDIDGVNYIGKEPDFVPFEDEILGHVELENFMPQRMGKEGTYANATQLVAENLGWQPSDVDRYMEEHGLTWHECGNRRTVRAIPTEINAAFKHTGGIGIEKSFGAMSKELHDRYGDMNLKRDSYTGTASMDEINEAIEGIQRTYKTRKRG